MRVERRCWQLDATRGCLEVHMQTDGFLEIQTNLRRTLRIRLIDKR
jgi:hypothetical protein